MKFKNIFSTEFVFVFLIVAFVASISVAGDADTADAGDLMICAKYPDHGLFCNGNNAAFNSTAPEKPPVDYIISAADYKGVVNERNKNTGRDTVSVSAIYDLEVLKDGWVEIPLLSSDVAIKSARMNGKEVSLLAKDGKHELITNEIGKHKLEIDFMAGITSAVDSYSFNFGIPKTSVSKIHLEIPKANISVSIPSSFTVQTTGTAGNDKKTYVSATLASTGTLSVKWSRKIAIPEPDEMEPKVYAEVYTLVSIGEGIISGDTTVQYSIVQAGIGYFSISLPSDVDVLSVTGNGLKNWKIDENVDAGAGGTSGTGGTGGTSGTAGTGGTGNMDHKILHVYLNSETMGTFQ